MNKAKFYQALRRRNSGVFGTSLSEGQVSGCDAILDECMAQGADLGQASYILATAYGETGGKMQPRRENMNYSAKRIPQVFSASRRQGISAGNLARNPELLANTVYGGAWGKRNLGNTMPGDGWVFRGAGIGQITGRYNFGKWAAGLGVDLIGRPELLEDLKISVRALVEPMLEGWATGKPLRIYVNGEKRDYKSARNVWNGSFEAAKYAQKAKSFESALKEAGYAPERLSRINEPPERNQLKVSQESGGVIGAILKVILAIFGDKK